MGIVIALAAVVCYVAILLFVVKLISVLSYAARYRESLAAAVEAKQRFDERSPRRVVVELVVVALCLVLMLLGSGNVRQLLGSREIGIQPAGRYAYMVELGGLNDEVRRCPAVVKVERRPSKLMVKGEDGTFRQDYGGTYRLLWVTDQGQDIPLPDEPEVSLLGIVNIPVHEGAYTPCLLLDEPAELPGFEPVMHRSFFFWADVLTPIPVLGWLGWLALLLRHKRAA